MKELDQDRLAELALKIDCAIRGILEKEDQEMGFHALVAATTLLVSYGTMQKYLDALATSADAREQIISELNP